MSTAAALSDRFLLAKSMQAETEAYFNEMSAGLSNADCAQWEKEILAAEADRLRRPAAMDILGARSAEPGADDDSRPRQATTDAEQWIELALMMEQWQ
jgi:hypothetical protein